MAWALYLSNATSSSVTDAQLAELDDYELAVRAGSRSRLDHLSNRIGHIVHALVCAAGAIKSRTQMLRSVTTLHSLLTTVSPDMLRMAVHGVVSVYEADPRTDSQSWNSSQPMFSPVSPSQVSDGSFEASPSVGWNADPPFLRPLVSIAVNRVSDTEISTIAADVLAILLGHPSFDTSFNTSSTSKIPPHICAQVDIQTRKVIAMLITEIVLTSSPRALAALSRLLRRDSARAIFCEKDGVSTLASTLQTQPGKSQTAIGEQVATVTNTSVPVDAVYASYHAVFSVWMLTFARRPHVVQLFLQNVVSSRLVVILARLLNHTSGQRLKIARVTLASLRNMASGETSLHRRIRRDMLAADVPAVLRRLMQMTSVRGSLMGTDDDAVADARTLLDALELERASMTTVDAYVAEVQAGVLHSSPVHSDPSFWARQSDTIMEQHSDTFSLLFESTCNEKLPSAVRVIACHDLVNLLQNSSAARRIALKNPSVKPTLMALMVSATDPAMKKAALLCVQHMLLRRSFRSDSG